MALEPLNPSDFEEFQFYKASENIRDCRTPDFNQN